MRIHTSLQPFAVLRWLAFLSLVASVTLFTQACSRKKPSPETSCNFVMNSDEQRVSWSFRTPVNMYVHNSVPQNLLPAIEAAAKEWNTRLNKEVIRIVGWTNATTEARQDGSSIIYYLTTWESERAREQARTTIYWIGDMIQEADMKVNAKDYEFTTADSPESGKIDFQSLMTHEFGHVLGLAHIEAAPSVMAKSLPYSYLRRTLSATDLDSVHCEY